MRHAEIASLKTVSEVQPAEFLRMPSVVHRTGLARSTIYRLIAERKFPSPVKLAGRAVGWRQSDLDRWSEDRPSAPH
jgi:prophage regulatory protein